MLGLSTDQRPIALFWGQSIAAHWSVCWPAGLAGGVSIALATSLWELDDLDAQLPFLSLRYNAIYYVAQAAILPRLFKKNYRSFFLATVDAGGAVNRAIPGPLLRLLALRLVLAQVALSCAASALLYITGLDVNVESNRKLLSFLRYAQILIIGPVMLHFALKAERPGRTISAFSRRY